MCFKSKAAYYKKKNYKKRSKDKKNRIFDEFYIVETL